MVDKHYIAKILAREGDEIEEVDAALAAANKQTHNLINTQVLTKWIRCNETLEVGKPDQLIVLQA